MNKKMLLLCGIAAVSTGAFAQSLQQGDVVFPASTQLPTYINQWASSGKFTVNGEDWEDQEFFTSRVKPRTEVTATGANARDFGTKAGRRTMWWVPIGSPDFQAVPNARFDSEAFSMWSYLHVYGQWTAPYGWTTGAVADIAHKNGVSVSGQASIPWGGIGADWRDCLAAMGNLSAENVGKFLYYHGCDGLSYNSEFSGGSGVVPKLITLHDNVFKYMSDKNPVFENIWYDGTTDTGNLMFDTFLDMKTGIYKSSSIFSNYNWVSPNRMSDAVNRANNVKDPNGTTRGPWWNYAGMNQQGGEPKSGNNYPVLKEADWSMGWWGAHSYNMFWEGRGGYGTDPMSIQLGYLEKIEQFFGNGQRNPAIHNEILLNRAHRPHETYHGAVEFVNERSTMNHNLGTEPFYSYFNLGNGTFFNWMGERVSNEEWYSIGVQDFMPTWRFWTSPQWLQKSIEEGDSKLKVGFTYEDAYFGGSCLKVEGTTAQEYLHLFKTQFTGFGNKNVTVRFKVLEGTADMRLVVTSANNPATESTNATLKNLMVFTADECPELENNSYKEGADGWQVKTFSTNAVMGNNTNMPGGVGAIGLEFKNAEGLKILLGEVSITPKSATTTPVAPQIRSAKVLRNVHTGVDGKLIWTMDNDVARQNKTPKYNSDVNTSMFKLYSEEEGGEKQFLGVTTSWAAVVFRAPNTDQSKKIRFGVSAVSMDTKTESAITWSNYMAKGDYQQSEEIRLNKTTIKPNESFAVEFVDQKHVDVEWAIRDQDGNTIATNTGKGIYVNEGISEWGGYDVIVGDREYPFYIQISEDKVGALPEIYTLASQEGSLEGVESVNISLDDDLTLSYTGRKADGSASRALNLNSRYIGAKIGDMGIQALQSLSIAGWFRFAEIPASTWNFMNISNKSDSWPYNTWGWSWNHGSPNGDIHCTFRGASSDGSAPGELHYTFPETKIQAGVWTHIAYVVEYAEQGFRFRLFINGKKQKSTVYSYAVGNNTAAPRACNGGKTVLDWTEVNGERVGKNDGDIYIDNQVHPISGADWAYFGGAAHQGSAIDGIVDDFQVWNKAMTEEDVKASMSGFPRGEATPEGLLCLWDFEDDADENNLFYSRGSNEGVPGCSHEITNTTGSHEDPSTQVPQIPAFDQGCPFLSGTAYPVVTEAAWSDNIDRKTGFEKQASGDLTSGEAGSAKVKFNREGDHVVTLTLENIYGSDSREFPVFHVKKESAIEGVEADEAGVNTYTVDRTLFVEFAEAGEYTVLVYNTAGMLVGNKQLAASAGQKARVDLGAAGVYLVKVVKNGQELRAVKVMSK